MVSKLNYFTVKEYLSPYYSPKTILDQQPLYYNKHDTLPFGWCVQENNDKIRKIQMFCGKLTAFTYNHWIKYKVEMRYFIYTVTELLQEGKLFKFQFLRQ